MGKKSKAKKNRKQEKKTQPKPPQQPRPISLNKERIFATVLGISVIFVMIVSGFLVFKKAFKATPIADFLPAEGTVAFLEMNSDDTHRQVVNAMKLLQEKPIDPKASFRSYLSQQLTLDYDTEINPWIGRSTGAALVKSTTQAGTINTVYFLEIINKELARSTFDSNLSDRTIYALESGNYITFIEDYLFLAPESHMLTDLINDQRKKSLSGTSSYQRVNGNLPINRFGFFFLNFPELDDSFFQKYPIFSENGVSKELIAPLASIFQSEGIAMIALEDNFTFETFINLNKSKINQDNYILAYEKYRAKLTEYTPDDVLIFWGGEDLNSQFSRMLELVSGGDEAVTKIFRSIAQSYSQKYLGTDFNYQRDILNIFKKEFAVTLRQVDNSKQIYTLLLELENPEAQALKIQDLANSFSNTGAIFEPRIVEYTLPDGTPSKEIIAVPEEVIREETNYKGSTIYTLRFGRSSQEGIHYSFVDKVAIVSSDIAGVRATIDLKDGERTSLKDSLIFTASIQPVLSSADEYTYIDFDRALPALWPDAPLDPILIQLVDHLSSGKNYFDDGIVSITRLHLN